MTVREFLSFSVKENVKTNLIILKPGGKQLYNGAADRLKDTEVLDEILAAGTYSLGREPGTVELLIMLKERDNI